MPAASIVPLISLWEEYLQQHKNEDILAFARWVIKEKQTRMEPDSEELRTKGSQMYKDVELHDTEKAMLFIYRLQRFVEMNSKPLIKEIGFVNPNEYAMLAEICLLNSPNKKEIAKKMLLENSTAVEISKRLVQRGFIKEVADPKDKRSTRLGVTNKGLKKLYESHSVLGKVRANFLKALNDAERKDLIRLLEQLEKYHSMDIET
jgi:DNA-binding MarR family transcriptional regulator